jgi:hypothetical protein
VKVNFVLDSGRIVKGTVVDPEGKPLAGVVAAGLNIDDWEYEPQPRLFQTADFTVIGLHPDRPRLLGFVYEKKKLAGFTVVRGDEKKPITVKLQPWAEVSGRLLDAQGKPIPNAALWFTEIPVRKPGQPMASDVGLAVVARYGGQPTRDPKTDDQGRFHIGGLAPGMKYNLAVMESAGAFRFKQIKWPGLVFKNGPESGRNERVGRCQAATVSEPRSLGSGGSNRSLTSSFKLRP